MDPITVFRDYSLAEHDAVAMAKALQVCIYGLGWDKCWDASSRSLSHSILHGFNTSHPAMLLYRGQDARPLLLALSGRYYQDARPIIVRRSCCKSKHCLNPTHLYYGTRGDVALETNKRNGTTEPRRNVVTLELINSIQMAKLSGESILKVSRRLKIPYHTTRRIYNEETYNHDSVIISSKYLESIQKQTLANCVKVCQNNPKIAREVKLSHLAIEKSPCPWHKPGTNKHIGNFGLMGECLDCMEEIRKGRCTVDVTEFSLDSYWTVKRFWDKVDIKGDDECWTWLGATRRDNTESIAYFPSPFHSGKTQSAPRVAYWLSRGYTGKYRVFSKADCQAFCCNPLHLTIREFKDMLLPAKIDRIRLKHDDIFAHARKSRLEMQPDPSQ